METVKENEFGINVELNKEVFIKALQENVQRTGIDDLIKWLRRTDFFTAPASTKFHSNFEGGLCWHSLLVYERLRELNDFYELEYDDETLAIVGLLHDVCKANIYIQEERNVKDENGKWMKKPYWAINDDLPLGHGEKSCMLIMNFISLDVAELVAIRWHMGGFDSAVKGGDWSASRASDKYSLVTLLQVADMVSSSLFERKVD